MEAETRASIARVHTRVDAIEKTTSSIETSAKTISDSVCKMERVMFGDQSADGLITKVSIQGTKLGGVYWLGGVIIIALVGVFVGIIFKK